jgi:hypothetical protein
MMSDRSRDDDQRDQERNQRGHAPVPRPDRLGRASLVELVLPGQVFDELAQLTDRLCLVAALEAFLQLGRVEPALSMAVAKPLGYPFAICVGSAEVGIASRDPIPEVLVGHLSLRSKKLVGIRSPPTPDGSLRGRDT